ncbi:hypothetical protein [Dactylosporangium sp. NPDC006015]|uniref:hypothetical protein n=1 Tax=Dactylosporangium sp. NPDC006015 TaxID=3154576 RepID=UPI0033B5C481
MDVGMCVVEVACCEGAAVWARFEYPECSGGWVDEWAYRLRDTAASERVRIEAISPKKSSVRVDVAFLDDPDMRVENVPAARLRVPWDEVQTFDALMDNWRRLGEFELDDVEQACVEEVFLTVIPPAVAELLWTPVSCATAMCDQARVSDTIDVPIEEIFASGEWFDHADGLMHAWMIRRHRVEGAYEPRAARWMAARFGPLPAPRPAGTYLARRAAKAFDRLLTGDLEPAEYRALMAAVAAQDAVARPLRVPR